MRTLALVLAGLFVGSLALSCSGNGTQSAAPDDPVAGTESQAEPAADAPQPAAPTPDAPAGAADPDPANRDADDGVVDSPGEAQAPGAGEAPAPPIEPDARTPIRVLITITGIT